ncbi:zinc knuckle family protein [Wuchereria bancrofti]|uniref:Zinc knuckle family protein n=1 Tax=Wuchereria bancrofti TaxID=6293 RepID=J9DRF0_WUCBA|nr:zinc knuckle family protein [Wuchereria bancrofti]
MVTDDRGILNLINIGTDTIITLSMYKDDAELALKRLKRNKEPSLTECRPVLIRGYDRAPENYEIIRELLVEKFGRISTIRKLLYNELISIKRNDRNWKTIVEEMERMLRQLEATGKNVEQPTIKTIIESKLPNWILNQVYQQKEND